MIVFSHTQMFDENDDAKIKKKKKQKERDIASSVFSTGT